MVLGEICLKNMTFSIHPLRCFRQLDEEGGEGVRPGITFT